MVGFQNVSQNVSQSDFGLHLEYVHTGDKFDMFQNHNLKYETQPHWKKHLLFLVENHKLNCTVFMNLCALCGMTQTFWGMNVHHLSLMHFHKNRKDFSLWAVICGFEIRVSNMIWNAPCSTETYTSSYLVPDDDVWPLIAPIVLVSSPHELRRGNENNRPEDSGNNVTTGSSSAFLSLSIL